MAGSLDLRVVTPEKPVFEGPVEFVVVPAHDGDVGILPRHARFLALDELQSAISIVLL